MLRTGEEVVVKVQRPGLRALFDIDLANLKVRFHCRFVSTVGRCGAESGSHGCNIRHT